MNQRADMTNADIAAVIGQISFPLFNFKLATVQSALALQIECAGTDNASGQPMVWTSRHWLIPHDATASQIVQTAFKAVLTAMEHEARELFTYRGKAVFTPHHNLNLLAELMARTDDEVVGLAMAAVEGASL